MMRNFFYAKDVTDCVTIKDFLLSYPDKKLTPQGLPRSYMSFLSNNYDIDRDKRMIMVYKDIEGMKFLTWHRMNNMYIPDIIRDFALVMEYQDGKLMCIEEIACRYCKDKDVSENASSKYPGIIVCQLE